MHQEAFLGSLPSGWSTRMEVSKANIFVHVFTHGNVATQQDPRVPLPPDWRYMYGSFEQPESTEPELIENATEKWFENEKTGEKTYYDPRLTPDRLKERGVAIRGIILVWCMDRVNIETSLCLFFSRSVFKTALNLYSVLIVGGELLIISERWATLAINQKLWCLKWRSGHAYFHWSCGILVFGDLPSPPRYEQHNIQMPTVSNSNLPSISKSCWSLNMSLKSTLHVRWRVTTLFESSEKLFLVKDLVS